jgi:hypothetical protein
VKLRLAQTWLVLWRCNAGSSHTLCHTIQHHSTCDGCVGWHTRISMFVVKCDQYVTEPLLQKYTRTEWRTPNIPIWVHINLLSQSILCHFTYPAGLHVNSLQISMYYCKYESSFPTRTAQANWISLGMVYLKRGQIWQNRWWKLNLGFSGKVKVKIKLSLCLTTHHAMKTYWGVEVKFHEFFDLGTRWRRVVSFTLWPL